MIPCHLCQTTSSLSYRDMHIIEDKERGLVSELSYTICYGCQQSRSTELLDAQGRAYYLAQFAEIHKHLPPEQQPELIAIDLLYDNPYQSRSSMDEEGLAQLAETIISQGFQGVLIARPHPRISGIYQLTAGHRRRDAARIAGLSKIPVIVRTLSNNEMAVLAATENLQREDLTPLDEGHLFQRMIEELGLNLAEVARAVKKHRNYVQYRLRLAQAPRDIQEFVISKPDSLRAVVHLLAIDDPAERAHVFELLRQKMLLTDDLPAYVEEVRLRKQGVAGTEMEERTEEVSLQQSEAEVVQEASAAASGPMRATNSVEMDENMASGRQMAHVNPAEVEEGQVGDQNGQAVARTAAIGAVQNSGAGQEGDAPAVDMLGEQQIRQRRLKVILRSLKQYVKSISATEQLGASERAMLGHIVESAQEAMGR